MRIGYFGEPGAYSNIAAINMHEGRDIPLQSVRSVFMELQNGNIDYGVVPVENSIEGSVNQTYDYLYKMPFYIVKEYYLRIQHCLIGSEDSSIENIKYAHSHPQALAQCSDFLFNKNIIPVNEYDTAGSALIIKKLDIAHAAIASEMAAKIYNMKILARDIENNRYNYTRFIMISKNPEKASGRVKTSIVFSTPNIPGALFNILKILNRYGINMSRIESRPVDFTPFNYIFFIDFENNNNYLQAISDMKNATVSFKEIGTYPVAIISK
ncbi:MAG: prephenate dehydratase [Ferroplasma sp.]